MSEPKERGELQAGAGTIFVSRSAVGKIGEATLYTIAAIVGVAAPVALIWGVIALLGWWALAVPFVPVGIFRLLQGVEIVVIDWKRR